jgi:hypothetical protein
MGNKPWGKKKRGPQQYAMHSPPALRAFKRVVPRTTPRLSRTKGPRYFARLTAWQRAGHEAVLASTGSSDSRAQTRVVSGLAFLGLGLQLG